MFISSHLGGQTRPIIKTSDCAIKEIRNKWNQTRYGVANASGSFIINPIYRRISAIGSQWYKVQNEKEKYGVLSNAGKEILTEIWNEVYFKDSFFVAIKNFRQRRFSIGNREAGPAYRLFITGDYYLFDSNGKSIPNSFKHIMFEDLEFIARNRKLSDYFDWYYKRKDR